MTWTVTKVFAFIAMPLGFILSIMLDDGNIWIGTMTACGIILGIKNLKNEKQS